MTTTPDPIEPCLETKTEKTRVGIAVTRMSLEPFTIDLYRLLQSWLQHEIRRGSWGLEIYQCGVHDNFMFALIEGESLATALKHLTEFGRMTHNNFGSCEIAYWDAAEEIWRTHLETPRINGLPFARFFAAERLAEMRQKVEASQRFAEYLQEKFPLPPRSTEADQ